MNDTRKKARRTADVRAVDAILKTNWKDLEGTAELLVEENPTVARLFRDHLDNALERPVLPDDDMPVL